MRIWRRLFACAALALMLCGGRGEAQETRLKHRWVWCMHNLQVESNVAVVQKLMQRAKAAGYNGIVLSDYKFNVLEQVPQHYFKNMAAVQKTAQELGLELIPCVFPIGYANGLLAHDPNLAEGLPVRDASFVVQNGAADIVSQAEIKNGNFETVNGDAMAGWDFQDGAGKYSFPDTTVTHGGKQSLRFEEIGKGDPQNGHGRIMQAVTLHPFRQYRFSVWIKTQGFDRPNETRALGLTPGGRVLNYDKWSLQPTQDWKQYQTVFNTLDDGKISLYLGSWGGGAGKIWFDDAKLEEVGLLNVLRRSGCPLTVRSEDSTLYTEGKDYAPVADERLGNVPFPGNYEFTHTPPQIRLLPGSRMKEGQTLRVSFYHSLNIYNDETCSCISDPKIYALLQDQLTRVNNLLHPTGYFMSHDEFRVANWCEDCGKRHLTPGQMLADNARRCIGMIRAANPKADIYVWNDMFDPFHNAVDKYYLVNGTWAGAWEGLAKEVTIVNWNSGKQKESMAFFAKRGHPQILAGYYDGPPQAIRAWLDNAKEVPNITGVMYTTWENRYDDLEAFAKAAWGGGK